MPDIASLGIKVTSDGIVIATDRLNKFVQSGGAAEGAANRVKTSSAALASTLQTLAAAFSIYKVIDYTTAALTKGITEVERYNMAVGKTAALITSMQGAQPGVELGEQYRIAKDYASALTAELEVIDAKTIAGAKDLSVITQEMLKQGVVLDINNAKQVEGFVSLANAATVFSNGMEVQLRQEVRALLQGKVDATSQLASQLDAVLHGQLKEMTAQWKEQGTLVENIGKLLQGYKPFSDEMGNSWDATKSTLETITNKILREGFGPAMKDIVGMARDLVGYLKDHGAEIAGNIKSAWESLKPVIVGALEAAKVFLENIDKIATAAVALAKIAAVGGALYALPTVFLAAQSAVAAVQNGVEVSAVAASGALGRLKIAGGVLFAAFAGWEIGKWLSDNFETARLAGVLMVDVVMGGFIKLEYAAKRAGLAIQHPFSGGDYAKELSALNTEYNKTIANHRSTIDGISASAMEMGRAQEKATKALSASAPKMPGGVDPDATAKAATEAKKLAEEWKRTEATLSKDFRMMGLEGLDRELMEITIKAEEMRHGVYDSKMVQKWEDETKAVARHKDEIEKTKKANDEYFSAYEKYQAAITSSLPKEQQAVAKVAQEYRDKQVAVMDAMNAKVISEEEAWRQSEAWAAKEEKAKGEAVEALRENADTTKKIWENMYTNLQSLTADWLYDMKISWSSLGDLFRKMVAQMVSAWAWGQASMAWGSTSGTAGTPGHGLSLANMGTGLAAVGGMAALGSTMSGPSTTNEALTSIGVGTAGVALEAYNGTSGALAASLKTSIADYVATNMSEELGMGIYNLTEAGFSGWAAGIGTFVISLLRGEGFKAAAFKGVGAGVGAWGGATLGATYGAEYLGSAAGPIGAVVGAALGAIIGGLFAGGGKENTFTLTELTANMDTSFDKLAGFDPTKWQHQAGGNEWYHGIANAYSDVITTIQEDFNANLFAFTDQLPETLQNLVLDNLAKTDFSAITSEASVGRWGVSSAQTALEAVAQNYAVGLAKAVNDAYNAALITFVSTADPSELLGADLQGTWAVLSDAAQAQVKGMFEAAGQAMQTGGLEAGLTEMNKITDIISQIKSATDPITEVIATNGMGDYEKQLRSINQQFDGYAATLQKAGIDLAKYTDLEKARGIALANAARDTLLADAEKNVRASFEAEQKNIAAQHESILVGLNNQLKIAQDASTNLTNIMGKLRSALDRMSLGTTAFTIGQRETAQATLQATLLAARNGDLSGANNLDQALDILSGSSEGLFASFEDYQRDFWKTYLSIAELEQISGDQLSVQDQTVALLEQQIADENTRFQAQSALLTAQLNALLEINQSVLSIDVATAQYQAAKAELDSTESVVSSPTDSQINQYVAGVIASMGETDPAALDIYNAARANGISASRLASATYSTTGWTEDIVNSWAANNGLPSFAVGTDYVPTDMTAKIHQGERITPAAYNRSDKTNAELLDELRKLRAEVSELRKVSVENVKHSQKTAKLMDAWDGDGMPEVRVL